MKKKVPFPVSIDKELAEKVRSEAEKRGFRNKSHLVEEAIKKYLGEQK